MLQYMAATQSRWMLTCAKKISELSKELAMLVRTTLKPVTRLSVLQLFLINES
jgi:hypothetical protein